MIEWKIERLGWERNNDFLCTRVKSTRYYMKKMEWGREGMDGTIHSFHLQQSHPIYSNTIWSSLFHVSLPINFFDCPLTCDFDIPSFIFTLPSHAYTLSSHHLPLPSLSPSLDLFPYVPSIWSTPTIYTYLLYICIYMINDGKYVSQSLIPNAERLTSEREKEP